MNWKAGTRVSQYKIIMTGRARNDIVDIGDYIAYTLLAPETALNFVTELRKSIATLKDFPQRCGLVDDMALACQGIHCMPFRNYYVFYEIIDSAKTVVILRIGYNRRNWKEILSKECD